MKKKLKIFMGLFLVLITVLGCTLYWYQNNVQLDVYSITNDGRLIIKNNNQYVFYGIANDNVRGKIIGKAEYNEEKYYVYQEKGKDIHDCIIIMGVDIGVNEEFINNNQ